MSGAQTDTNRDGFVVETMPRLVAAEASSPQSPQPNDRSCSNTASADSIAIENLGRGVKELVQAMRKIENLGITKVAGDIPKIVVIGDQSAGKSSVINAISAIQVPCSSGTCTCCPMQITLAENKGTDARWRCDVSLRKEFLYDADSAAYPPSQNPPAFFPWEESNQPETIHFKTVYNKIELQNVIYQAQLATLNPGSDPSTFVPLQPSTAISGGQYQVEFSPNVVCLDISAPELPNLSFYDLPGVISHTENSGDLSLIKLVKQLVKRYVSKDNALVILACSMENDIQNSSSAALLRKYGAIDRCLGILTIPDSLPRGDVVDRWEGIIQGHSFQLGHGYHFVRTPSQAELDSGMTDHASARQIEKDWFVKMKPWYDRFLSVSDRFGTERLQDKLSQMLAIQILKSLPSIHDRVQEQLRRVDSEIMRLPEPPTTNARDIVLDTINSFTNKVSKQIEGDYPENQFRLAWRGLSSQFCDLITAQRPTMLVRTAADVAEARRNHSNSAVPQPQSQGNSSFSKRRNVISIEDSDNERAVSVKPTPTKKRKMASNSTPSRRGQPGDKDPKRFKLESIRSTLEDMSSSDIPGEIDPKGVDYLKLETINGWPHPTKDFLDGLYTALRNTLNKALDDTLRERKATELFKKIARLSERFLEVAFAEQRDVAVPRALKLERHKPITENAAALELNEKQELDILQNARVQARTNLYFDEVDVAKNKKMPQTNRQKKAKNLTCQPVLGLDPFSREVEAMAKVRGYYNVASMRYVDAVVMGIQAELFEKLEKELKNELFTALGIDGADVQDTCARLLAEDPDHKTQRHLLEADKNKLVAVLQCLQELHPKYKQGFPTSSAFAPSPDGTT